MNTRISTLAKAVKEHPDDPFYKFALALEMIKKKEHYKALILFETILNDNPDYIGVYYHLAKLYEVMGESEKAIKTYKEGIKIAENQHDNHTKSELSEALYNLEIEMKDQ